MPSRIWGGLVGQLEDARRALRDAPVEVALGWFAAISLSVSLEANGGDDGWLPYVLAAALAFPIAFAFSVLRAAGAVSARARWIGTAAGLALAALYAFATFDHELPSEAWRAACLFGACAMLPVLVPIRARAPGETGRDWFWLYNTRLAIRFVTVYGFAALLALGLNLAVAAIGNLFDLSVPDRLYGHITGLMFLALAPWALAGGISDLLADPADERDRAARHARRAGVFLALPLLIVYVTILYGYAVKIALTGEIPRNVVSPVVLGAGALWTLAAVALEPVFWAEPAPRRGIARFLRLLPFLMLPLLVLGGWAIGLRVAEYGWTEFRYIRMLAIIALAAVAIVGAAFVTRGGPPPLRSLPIAALVALLIAALGPFSAPAVALRSQRDMLERGLAQAGLREPGGPAVQLADTAAQPTALREVDQATYDRITGSAFFLVSHFGEEAVDGLIDRPVGEQRWEIGTALGIAPMVAPDALRYVDASLAPGTAVEIPAAATLYAIELVGDSATLGPISVRYSAAEQRLDITLRDGGRWSAELDSTFQRISAAFEAGGRGRPPGAAPRPMPAPARRYLPGSFELTTDLALVQLTGDIAGADARLLLTAISYEVDERPQAARRGPVLRGLEGWLIVQPRDP